MTAYAPRKTPASMTLRIVFALLLISASMGNVAMLKYVEAATAVSVHERWLRTAIACAPMLGSLGLAAAVCASRGTLFWDASRVALSTVSAVRLAGSVCLRRAISPAPALYPPGLPFGYSLMVNAVTLFGPALWTLENRLWVSSTLLGRRPSVAVVPNAGPVAAASAVDATQEAIVTS